MRLKQFSMRAFTARAQTLNINFKILWQVEQREEKSSNTSFSQPCNRLRIGSKLCRSTKISNKHVIKSIPEHEKLRTGGAGSRVTQ
jgi:hypothetical protein